MRLAINSVYRSCLAANNRASMASARYLIAPLGHQPMPTAHAELAWRLS